MSVGAGQAHVWLLNPFDALPDERWGHRNSLQIATVLAEAGIRVTWVAADFAHFGKVRRDRRWHGAEPLPGVRLHLVPVRPYRRHVGLARIGAYRDYARGVAAAAARLTPPTTVLLGAPTPFLDDVAVLLAAKASARLVVHLIDLWPELLEAVLPAPVRVAAFPFSAALRRARRRALSAADVVLAVSDEYAEAARAAGAPAHVPVRVVPFTTLDLAEVAASATVTPPATVPPRAADEVRVVYAGTLGEAYGIPELVDAARHLASTGTTGLRVLVAGDGPARDLVTRAATGPAGRVLTYVGTMDKRHLYATLRDADAGLALYAPGSTVSVPAKSFDYLGCGVPVIHTLGGGFAARLAAVGAGERVPPGDAMALAGALAALAARPAADRARARAAARALGAALDWRQAYAAFVDTARD